MQSVELSTHLPELSILNSCYRCNITMGDIWQGEREMGACPSWGTAELRDKNRSSCEAHVWSHDRRVYLMLSPTETYALLLSYPPTPKFACTEQSICSRPRGRDISPDAAAHVSYRPSSRGGFKSAFSCLDLACP